ncbi:MAG: hypothetical protein QW775_02005 [Ignisphaera sp.]|uniref:Uncharacterized protein n=1 Tax=Ignisphaera aggregans TaxID=334771 RepID=A0A7C4NND3_9CREN
MKLNEEGLGKYRAYVLYGKNVENILQRIITFVGGCKNVVADVILGEFLRRLCSEDYTSVELKDYRDVDKVISLIEEGKAIAFFVESPRNDVYAIALIPVDEHNKAVVG